MLSGTNRPKAEINVTPMIDVLLVLLVIFMVVKAPASNGLEAQIPQPPDSASRQPEHPVDIVVTVRSESIQLNQETVRPQELPGRLLQIFKVQPDRVMFIRAEKDLPFGRVAQIIDQAKGAGVDRVALMSAI